MCYDMSAAACIYVQTDSSGCFAVSYKHFEILATRITSILDIGVSVYFSNIGMLSHVSHQNDIFCLFFYNIWYTFLTYLFFLLLGLAGTGYWRSCVVWN